MRPIVLLFMATSLATQFGCSAMIARTGTDLASLTSRDGVIEMFGPPSSSVQTKDTLVETFKTRRKIADPMLAWGYGMEFCMVGIFEPENTAAELIGLARNKAFGQTIQFTFDSSDDIITYQSDDHDWKERNLYPLHHLLALAR